MATTIDKYKLELDVVGERAVKALDNAVNNLATRLAQLGIAAFATNAFRMADAMKDLADATGLTSGYVKTFADGLQKAGGDAAAVDKVLTTFYRTIEDMAAGSDNAERSLAKLGITFQDLQTKSERDILAKTVKSLAEMEQGAERTALGMSIFGKAFAQIDPRVLDQILQTSNVELLTAQLNKAAETVAAMEQNYRDLQVTAIAVLNSLVGDTDKLRLNTEALAFAVKAVATLMAVSFGMTALRTIATLTTAFITLRKEILLAAGATTLLGAAQKALGKMSLSGKTAIGAAFVGIGAAAAIKELYNGYKEFSKMVDNAANSVLGFNAVASDLDGVPMMAMKKYSDGIKELQKQLKAGTISQEEFNRKAEELATAVRTPAGGSGAFPDAGPFTEQEKESRARAAAAAQRQTELLRNQFELQQAYARSLLETIGMDENRAALIRELAAIQEDYDERRLDYQEKIADELAKGKDANLALVAEYVKQFEALDQQQQATEQLKRDENGRLVALKQTTVELEKQIGLINAALEVAKNQIEVTKFLAIARGELSEDEAEYQAERQRIQAESDARIKELEAALKNEINDINKQKIQNEIDTERARTEATLEGIEQRREAEQEAQKSSAAGFKKVFEEIAKSTSPYQVAVDSLQSAFRSVDNALTEFVTKGKFNFKEFARSLLADIALIIARALLMRAILGIVGIFNPAAASSLGNMLGVTGKAAGGPVVPGKAYLVGEKGPELAMFDRPGTIVPNNALGMGTQQTTVNYNINAVDAASFRSMVARDPQFIYNVTEVGRRSSPARRLA